ncbi:acyl-CoA dehydrogenase family protein [Sporomusa sp.]|uniref:acyl-CoA dehydrogenase family protein n=1 Tax=Sporomusa sp. TaxID=2078658 RepID=UPI002BB2280A|nr:acyl-CoA dehydrogenase family protein [Sporomusa sp.]HWR05444.1 acyl-CoA dehydrogenase family protein [Sporomusa sp.]
MERILPFTDEHEVFRTAFCEFLDQEVVSHYGQWEKDGGVPREVFKKFGDLGYLCIWLDEKYGGVGGDLLYSVIQAEEMQARGLNSLYTRLHGDVIAPYIYTHGSEELKQRWLPACAAGEKILAVAMSEPQAGSDLASLATSAVKEGDNYIVNGNKAWISNGMLADLVVVAVRTDPKAKPYKGISLLLVETNTPGFSRNRVQKIGMHAQDTAELFFSDCKVPQTNLLGEENKGFYYLMEKLQWERIMAAVCAVNQAQYSLALTIPYVKERKMFNQTLSSFQNTQFELAKAATEIEVAKSFVDQLVVQHLAGQKISKEVAMAKYYCCDLAFRTADRCVQLFGGYGLCEEYPIARQFVDSRFLKMLGGTSEVQLVIIAKELGL